MHIWIINQSFRPEQNAPANRFLGLAQAWQVAGHSVVALAGLPYRPTGNLPAEYADIKTYRDDEWEGIAIRRHAEPVTTVKKAWPQLKAQLKLAKSIWKYNKSNPHNGNEPDVIVASVPDFFHLFAAWRLAKRYNAKLVIDIRDLWPDIFVGVGVLKNKFLLWCLHRLANFGYSRGDAAVTVTRGMKLDLNRKGVAEELIHVLPNGLRADDFEAIAKAKLGKTGDRLRAELHINPLTKVVLYLGNHGKAQALGQIIDAARLMMNRSDILFLIVGDGADKPRIEELAKGLPNVQLLGQQSKDVVWAFYDLCTLSISCLQDTPVFKSTVPSKIAEIMANGKPVIAAVQGEAAENVQQARAGLTVHPETPEALAQAIITLVDDPDRCVEMGKNGEQYARRYHHLGEMAKQYLAILEEVVEEDANDK